MKQKRGPEGPDPPDRADLTDQDKQTEEGGTMKLKKAAAIALAFATAAALSVPATALAADPTATVPGTPNVTAADGTMDSTLTGTIKTTTLSVSVPTAATFNVDPGKAAAAGDGGQFESPTNYTITNKSVVPVYAYVSKVTASKVALTDDKGAVAKATTAGGADAKIQFAVKDAAPANFDTKADWLTTTTSKYYAFNAANTGKIEAGSTTPQSKTMKFYGQVPSENWTNAQTFTVTPTFTISATVPA